jgi:hypothetical protein
MRGRPHASSSLAKVRLIALTAFLPNEWQDAGGPRRESSNRRNRRNRRFGRTPIDFDPV